jgi:hypothetical protein
MLNFTYEYDVKIKNKHVAGISKTSYLSTETIRRPPQSRETIPLMTQTKDNVVIQEKTGKMKVRQLLRKAGGP